ncbi:GGDEF domain-containing protein [Arenimonas sp.]|uniref:GGDEF domain-containing protein n=1 Tax=Arenimonas sp. TaxID=1872635 RepID=UPI0039E3CE29
MPLLFTIEPHTVFLVATLMILLNGGVLGLMHDTLAPDVQPSAFSWRVATLLQAAGCILQAVQAQLPAGFVLPLANACILLGMTGYLRALRQFYGLPDRWSILWPAVIGTFGVFWFAAIHPNLGARILFASLALASVMFACVYTLQRYGERQPMTSQRVQSAIFMVIALLMVVRAVQTLFIPPAEASLLQTGNSIRALALVVMTTLPVIGTTAFLLMCSERIRRQWQQAASTDYLTGLANRRTVAQAGMQAFALARREGGQLSLAVLDVDHFKRINDQHGHDTGDLALKYLAEKLLAACDERDLTGRLGGEEFILLWRGADAVRARRRAERLQDALRAQPLHAGEAPIALTVSIGIAVLDESHADFEDLLRQADRALYSAKAGGRDRVVLASAMAG